MAMIRIGDFIVDGAHGLNLLENRDGEPIVLIPGCQPVAVSDDCADYIRLLVPGDSNETETH